MKKKIVSGMLILGMMTGLLAGCGGKANEGGSAQTPDAPRQAAAGTESADSGAGADRSDLPVVKVMIMDLFGTGQPDIGLVEEKMNGILADTAQAQVELEVIPVASYSDTLTMRIASGEPVDIAVAADAQCVEYQQQGMFLDMSGLIEEYGQDILSAFRDNGLDYLLNSCYYGDKLYYLANIEAKGFTEYLAVNKDILDECGIDAGSITCMEDMDAVFETVHAKYPDMECLTPYNAGEDMVFMTGSGFNVWNGFEGYDPLGDSMGALMSFDSTELINPYKTDEYRAAVTMVRDWYEKGYISRDVATATDGASVTFKAGNTFSTLMMSELTADQYTQYMNDSGYDFEVVCIPMTKPVVNTRRAGTFIPASSDNPEAAMRVINELYSDGELIDTFFYGVEGTHYYINDENGVIFTEEDGSENGSSNSKYSSANYFLMGNLLPAHCKQGVGGQVYHDNIVASLTESAVLPSLGFSFDYSAVSAEYAAVTNVIEQYRLGLGTGSMDPDTTLDEFIQKLDAAGIDKIIAAKQEQFEAFMAERK